jgi:hypothetical protein
MKPGYVGNMAHCLVDAVESGGDQADTKLQKPSAAIARLVRSRSGRTAGRAWDRG